MSHHFIRYSNVKYEYPDGTEALKGISFEVRHGERVALLGLNGSGKSTLLLLSDGLLFPSSGEVNVGDIPLTKKTSSLIKKSVGFMFQDPDDMLFMPTVYDDVAFGPRNMKLPEKEIVRRVEGALKAMKIEDIQNKSAFELSGGQKRSAAFASVLSMEPDILLLDEPSANLDVKSRRQLINLLNTFHHTIIVATHDLAMASELCDRCVVLNNGEVLIDARIEEVIENGEFKKHIMEKII